MKTCNWIVLGKIRGMFRVQCSECKRCTVVKTLEEKRQCGPPSIIQRGAMVINAHARWLAAGSPVRDPDAIKTLYSICEACPRIMFTEREGSAWCRECGCHLASAGVVLNKIAMATESCPLGKW